MKILFRKLLLVLVAMGWFLSCDEDLPEAQPQLTRTVIVYMIADNGLYDDAIRNLRDMEKNWGDFNGNLIVYFSSSNESPYLLKIQNTHVGSKKVKEYPSQNAYDVATMKKVYADAMAMFPAKSYGTIIWAPSTAWLPAGVELPKKHTSLKNTENFHNRIIGSEQGKNMDIRDLAKALPDGMDFIIFDADLMANIETLYELKNKAEYILASAAEVNEMGYPYHKILPYLYGQQVDLKKIAEEYFSTTNELTGLGKSPTISLIKTSEIEKLADMCLKIVNSYTPSSINLAAIQRLDSWSTTLFFDFTDFLQHMFSETDFEEFNQQMDKVILYKNNSAELFNHFPIKNHCGLSCYIPNSTTENINKAYLQTAWSKASGLGTLCVDSLSD